MLLVDEARKPGLTPMVTWFDESRLDDELALAAPTCACATLAESGARVRREAGEAAARDRRGGRPRRRTAGPAR